MPRGRPPKPGTAEEKAAARREKVRLNVKAYRERKKQGADDSPPESTSTVSSGPSPTSNQESPRPRNSISAESVVSTASATSTRTTASKTSDKFRTPKHEDGERAPDVPTEAVEGEQTRDSVTPSTPGKALTKMLVAPRGNNAFAHVLLGTFRQDFLPGTIYLPQDFRGGTDLVTPCSAWITNAYSLASNQREGALKNSLLAVGLSLTGMKHQDQRLKIASMEMYRKTLRQIRSDLQPMVAGTQRSATHFLGFYFSCLAATMFELLQTGFAKHNMPHVKGAGLLAELLHEVPDMNTLLADMLLEDYRLMELIFCLRYRFESSLLRRRKQAARQRMGSQSREITSNDPDAYNTSMWKALLDIADEIPSVMVRLDQLGRLSGYEQNLDEVHAELQRLTQILDDLDLWELNFHMRFGPPLLSDESVSCTTIEGCSCARFASYELGAIWVYYLTFGICTVQTTIEALHQLLKVHRLQTQSPSFNDQVDEIDPHTVPANMRDAPPPSKFTRYNTARLHQLRRKLRSASNQLAKSLHVFSPSDKGFTGQSLVIFPLDRAKAILELEKKRLDTDWDALMMRRDRDRKASLTSERNMTGSPASPVTNNASTATTSPASTCDYGYGVEEAGAGTIQSEPVLVRDMKENAEARDLCRSVAAWAQSVGMPPMDES